MLGCKWGFPDELPYLRITSDMVVGNLSRPVDLLLRLRRIRSNRVRRGGAPPGRSANPPPCSDEGEGIFGP
jgi:hypothetical protein